MYQTHETGAEVSAYRNAVKIARQNQPDPEVAADALEESGFDFVTARRALRTVFGYDVLASRS